MLMKSPIAEARAAVATAEKALRETEDRQTEIDTLCAELGKYDEETIRVAISRLRHPSNAH